MVGYRQRNRIAKTPTGNRKGSRVTEITGSLFSCPHSEIKATGRKDFRYCNTAHRRTGRESGRTISKRVSNCERSMKSDWKSPQNRTDIVKHNHRLQAERSTMDFSSYYYYIPLNFYETQCGLHLHRLRPSTIACGEMRLRREAPSPRKRSLHRRDACCGH